MCGICGEIRFDDVPVSPGTLSVMTDALWKRGPDTGGACVQGRLGFGHRRLKIIDLSEAAQQPMVDPELGLGIVFNGAVYNYRELRGELRALGYRFFSSGDTEVILKAYHAWGRECVTRFNGMFAFAVWERDSGRVLLARDRLGIKPLYYHLTPARLRFASSLPALTRGGGVDAALDPVALHHYLTFHSVVPAPRTLLRDVRKLPPATTMLFEPDGRIDRRTYWRLSFERDDRDAGRGSAGWQEEVLESLRLAVRRRLVADVPVGVLLSGGLDSSLITALLAEAGQTGLATFSVGFEAVNGEEGDEFVYSDLIAERFATDHRRIFVDQDRVLPALTRAVEAMAEPMVSHDAVAFYLLSEEVSKDRKVVLSGQGADEVFAGYHWYPPLLESDRGLDRYAEGFFDRDHDEMEEVLHPAHLGADHSRRFVERHFAAPGAATAVDRALRLDTGVMLIDDPVKRVDNMTMAWGLEARVPFLDHELVELAARIPPELKVADGGKHVLKEAARAVLPHEVIDRPKGYFPLPALKYLRGEYLEFVGDILTSGAARGRGLFRQEYVEKLLADPDAHITPLRGSKLWQLALLEHWLQVHDLGSPDPSDPKGADDARTGLHPVAAGSR